MQRNLVNYMDTKKMKTTIQKVINYDKYRSLG